MTQVRVKDFGPISQASVDIKPLTVFIGPNNSGKSYLALAVYCLSRTLSVSPPFRGIRRWPYGGGISPELLQRAAEDLKKEWPKIRSLPPGPVKVSELPEGFREALVQSDLALGDSLSFDFGKEIERCYGTEISSLVRRGSILSASRLEVGLSQSANGLVWEMQATQQEMTTRKWNNNLLEQTIDIGRIGFPLREMIDDIEYCLSLVAFELQIEKLPESIIRAHYMPASRSGILLGHKTLAGLIVGQASRAWLEPIEIPRLPGVITDLIQAILMLEHYGEPSAELVEVISFLESGVARGIIDVEPAPEYPEVYYENESGKFRLHQVSSMVSEVAPIILFLKHLVRPGHLFIIEEPESHIDAENQRKLAQAIAMLINAGVKVLVTTHSDYFVNQINNLLLLSQLTPRKRAARRYSASEVLDPNDVGAYFFEPGEEGSVVQELEVTAEEGISTAPFTDVHSALYNEAIALEHASN